MEDSTNPPEGRLLKVYPPEGAKDDTSVEYAEYSDSVIAIHGLGTTTPHTWEYNTKTKTVNWLSDPDMLPNIVPSASIYTFSWNAKYYADASVARIDSVAGVLLSNLQSQRDKALEIANIHGSQYRNLVVANSGVVFLGSPLQGTKASKAAQWHAMLGGILNKAPSKTLLQGLDGSTRALRESSEKFVTMVTTLPIQTMTMCFWESKKTQVLKGVLPAWTLSLRRSVEMILVEEDSACLFGHPKTMLDAPHSMMSKFSGPNDASFVLVTSAIKKMVEEAKTIAVGRGEGIYWSSLAKDPSICWGNAYIHLALHLHSEHFMVPRRPNTLFTGREKELGELEQALCTSLSTKAHTAIPKIYVIVGMGGAGKSEVALKLAHDNRLKFWGIFWIDGRSESSIKTGFATTARSCGHHDESLEGVMSWLQNTSHSWLLILDNADNKDLDYAQFLPAGKNGSILITTRLLECRKHQTVGQDNYEGLGQETAIELLLKACGIEMSSRRAHEDNARAVAELLGCHALAIIQAGAAISQNLCGLVEYGDTFVRQRRALFECFPKQERSEYGGVYATFEVSATYLKDRDDQIANDALQLLNFYAFMHFTDFPEAAFEEAWKNSMDEDVVSSCLNSDDEEDIWRLAPWHVSHLPTFLRPNLNDINLDKMRLRKARSLLTSLSLVDFDPARGTTRMHPVSHFWSRDRLQMPEDSMTARLNGLSVLSLSIEYPRATDIGVLVSQLQPHIESIAYSLSEWDSQKCNFHFQQSICRLSYAMYLSSSSSALFELLQMIPIQADETWIRTENGQEIHYLHGISMLGYGDAGKAVVLLEKLSEAQEQTLAAEDPMFSCSQHALASAYLKTEETTKAIELFERIAHVENETLGPEHSNNLASQHILAIAYLEVGETAKAIALLEPVEEIGARTLRPEHPHRLASQHELARAYFRVGETAKAMALLELVVEIEARTLRPEHSNRLASQHVLARAYLKVEETAKAIALLESVVEIRARTLGPEHLDLLVSQHSLAGAYLDIGQTAKAIALLEPVVEIEVRTLSKDHVDRVNSVYVLAACHHDAGNYEQALQLARSIENVARNRPGQESGFADWNAELIGYIIRDRNREEAS
ncbi:hypothetical protein HO133_006548 [Letharia lupina]|uniref:NB-ARC domain-containing protein n=1 Tax=Letharia lupina TaxID=560253 RepID=A0A8H6C6W6_9LECA|nr:uncharacterized protein HO133_006548 [Letharia lupina]KAF6217721.1 hypothetical protein HO133_006548 [Letharia lupina]